MLRLALCFAPASPKTGKDTAPPCSSQLRKTQHAGVPHASLNSTVAPCGPSADECARCSPVNSQQHCFWASALSTTIEGTLLDSTSNTVRVSSSLWCCPYPANTLLLARGTEQQTVLAKTTSRRASAPGKRTSRRHQSPALMPRRGHVKGPCTSLRAGVCPGLLDFQARCAHFLKGEAHELSSTGCCLLPFGARITPACASSACALRLRIHALLGVGPQ